MVLCHPEYPPNLRNQLPTRWKIHKPPNVKGSKFFRKAKYSQHSLSDNTVTPRYVGLRSPRGRDKGFENSQQSNQTDSGSAKSLLMNPLGCTPGQEFMLNDYFACVGWEGWALLGRVYSPYRHYIVLKDREYERRMKENEEMHKVISDRNLARKEPVGRVASQLDQKVRSAVKSLPKPRSNRTLVETSKFLYRIVAYAEYDDDILTDWNTIMRIILPKLEALERPPSVYQVEEMLKDLRQVESEARGFEITDEGINVCQIKHYQVMHNIGKGAFGVVKQGRHETTNRKVALKIVLTKSGVSHKVEDEGNLMIGLHHPHVIRLYEVIKRPDYICMAVELCSEGSLLTLIVSETKLRENLARRLVYETALGLEYLHSQWVIHRDIKPENILLNSNMQVKITDFGCAMKLKHKNEKLEQIIGTLDYAAPEIIDSSYRGQPVDVWSLGVTYYYMLFGALPFKNEGEDIFEFLDRIRDSDLELPEKVSEEVEMLVRGLLQPTPYRRTQLSKFITNSYFAPEKSTFDAKIKANVCSSDEQRQKFMDFSDETITQFISHVDDASEWEPYAQDKVTGISTMVRKNANSQICVRSQGNILFGGQFQDDMARGLMVSKGNRNVSVMIEQLREHEEIIYYAPAYLIEPLKDYDLPYKFEFLYLQVQRELKDERRFAVIRSIEHPAAPPQTGRVRGHISFAGYVLEKLSEDAHRCTVIHELDLNAELDVNVLELLNHSIMEFILRVRENLRNEKNGMVWKFL